MPTDKNYAYVELRIDWYSALNAVIQMAESRELQRMSLDDAVKLETAAAVIRRRFAATTTMP